MSQLKPLQSKRTRQTVYPTAREVLLARLLLQLIDVLGTREDMDIETYNEVKAIAEPIVRESNGN